NLFYVDETLSERLARKGRSVGVFSGTAGNASWRLVGSQDIPGSRWKLFQHFDFGGWNCAEGAGRLEGPYPQWNLPLVCWGRGEQTRLTFEQADANPQQLLMSCRASTPGQSVTIFLDGKQICSRSVPSGEQFADVFVPLAAAQGTHELCIRYALWKE